MGLTYDLVPLLLKGEIYGWLIAHYCIRATIFDAAIEKDVSPLRISFTGSLKVIRRAVPLCQSNSDPELDSHYYSGTSGLTKIEIYAVSEFEG